MKSKEERRNAVLERIRETEKFKDISDEEAEEILCSLERLCEIIIESNNLLEKSGKGLKDL